MKGVKFTQSGKPLGLLHGGAEHKKPYKRPTMILKRNKLLTILTFTASEKIFYF